MLSIGNNQAAIAIAKGPAPTADNIAVINGNPNIMTKLIGSLRFLKKNRFPMSSRNGDITCS